MVKKEFDCVPNQVFERKSVRRRMTRDIYFVFEEGKKKCSKIRGSVRSKSKFGHLKVGEVHRNGTFANNILYSIKNKGKCFINANYSVNQMKCNQSNDSQIQFPVSHLPIAKVNPIFVWVKQDDTRIVEVRCEDYDKRNRIRLTKTLNGWRATPRTDTSSSRVVKLIPKNLQKVTLETQSADYKNKNKAQLTIPKDKHDCNDSKGFVKKIQNNLIRKRIRPSFVSNEINSEESNDTLDNSNNSVHFSKHSDYEKTLKDTAENVSSVIGNGIKNKLQTGLHKLHPYDKPDLQLCPETGLFIPKIRSDLEDSDILDFKGQTDKTREETKNFIDLLQNCSNNDRTDYELMNSFVKNSLFEENCSNHESSGISSLGNNICNNLIHCDVKERSNIGDFNEITKTFLRQEPVSKILSHIRNSITESPEYPNLSESGVIRGGNVDLFHESSECPNVKKADKMEDHNVDLQNGIPECPILNEEREIRGLSIDIFHNDVSECPNFSGDGEIGLNVDLFQTKSFIDVKKDTNMVTAKEPQFITNILPDHKKYHIASKVSLGNFAEEFPEDLSYRKVEGMCDFSELNKYPLMSSNVLKSCSNSAHIFESNSETITNIFKQFSMLAPFNSLQTQQTEPINLEKEKESNFSDEFCLNCLDTTSQDIRGEEPNQKRVRSSVSSHESKNKLNNIRNDPDPLSQLKILIQNSQWKLPDPILVPRERLGAILESPAREIPLLLTTRPELKLPEAFSHPEILKNPNILVISIAQLEAILRVGVETKIQSKDHRNVINLPFSSGHLDKKTQNNLEKIENRDFSNYSNSDGMNCSQTSTCFESNLNTARLTVLNKMLLLPYSYGPVPSDVVQLIKEDAIGQTNSSNSYFLSLYNQQFPKANMNEVYDKYKNINIPMNLKQNDHITARQDNPNRKRELLPSIELPMLEELLQSKMQRLQSINKIISEIDENIIASSNKPCLNQKTFAVLTSHNDLQILKESIIKNNSLSNMRSKCNATVKSSFVNSINHNVDLSNITWYKNLGNHKKNIECKPKLTCKSLSNLIYPENIKHTAVPLLNLIASNDSYLCEFGDIEHENIRNHIERLSSPTSVSTNCTHNGENGVATEKTESNAALRHTLFESYKTNGYCSPWQWTTITSPGE